MRTATDALVPKSAHSRVTARFGPTTGNFIIPVYYCAEEGTYDDDDLAEAVRTLNEEITPFFAQASSGALEYTFRSGAVVSPTIPWDTVNLSYLRDHSPHIDENPCFIAAHNHALTETLLVLADMPAGGIIGYAVFYDGPAIVVTEGATC